jgi:hypothetical protein
LAVSTLDGAVLMLEGSHQGCPVLKESHHGRVNTHKCAAVYVVERRHLGHESASTQQ